MDFINIYSVINHVKLSSESYNNAILNWPSGFYPRGLVVSFFPLQTLQTAFTKSLNSDIPPSMGWAEW